MAVVGSLNVFELPNGDEYTLEDSAIRASVANDFDSTHTYADGDYCLKEGTLYKFNKAHTGAWDAADADAVQLVDEMKDAADASKADKVDLAPTFSTSESYAVGDMVIYENVLYRCKTAHAAGAWASADFHAFQRSSFRYYYSAGAASHGGDARDGASSLRYREAR